MPEADDLALLRAIARLIEENPDTHVTARIAGKTLDLDREATEPLQAALIENGFIRKLDGQSPRLGSSPIDTYLGLTADGQRASQATTTPAAPPDGSQPNADTWNSRDLPVLRVAVQGVDAEPVIGITFTEVAEHTGLSLDDVYRSAKAMESAGLVGLREVMGTGHSRINEVDGRARVIAGQWPSEETGFDRMIAALEAIAANSEDPDTRTRARKILEGFAGAGKTIGIGVTTAVITGQMPGA